MLVYIGIVLGIAVVIGLIEKRKRTNIEVQKLTGKDVHTRESILSNQKINKLPKS